VSDQRLKQVETDVHDLQQAMTQLTNNVNEGFQAINSKIAEGNKETLKEVGKLYGEINERTIEMAKKDNVNWSLIISAIAVILVGAGFFYTTINDRIDASIKAEQELRKSETEKAVMQSEINYLKMINQKQP
jgi:peptidoglycan hydrolase CwlO-like protein